MWFDYDYCRVLLLSENESCALMVNRDGRWDWPLFKYLIAYNTRERCVADFNNVLGLDPALQCFTPLVSVWYSSTGCTGPCSGDHSSPSDFRHFGQAVLLWLECHVESFVLPDGFEWKNSDFVGEAQAPSNSDNFFEMARPVICEVLDMDESLMKEVVAASPPTRPACENKQVVNEMRRKKWRHRDWDCGAT